MGICCIEHILRVHYTKDNVNRTPSFWLVILRLTSVASLGRRPTFIITNDLLVGASSSRAAGLLDFLVAAEVFGRAAKAELRAAHIERTLLCLAPLRAPAGVAFALCITARRAVPRRTIVGAHATDLVSLSMATRWDQAFPLQFQLYRLLRLLVPSSL